MTTDETVDCYNCGRSNPEWAQVCRSCGVPLRHGQARVVPTGRIPTDRNSLHLDRRGDRGHPRRRRAGHVPLKPQLDRSTRRRGCADADPDPVAVSRTYGRTTERDAGADSSPPHLPYRARSPSVTRSTRTAMVANPSGDVHAADRVCVLRLAAGRIRHRQDPERNREDRWTGPRRSCFPARASPSIRRRPSFGYVVGTAGDFLGAWGPGQFEWRVLRRRNRRRAGPVPVLRGLASRRSRRPRPRHRHRGARGRAGSRGSCAGHRSRWWHRG